MVNTSLKKNIIAIGGGKGGVGKSTVAAGLGMCIGNGKKKTLLVDADFTSSNLHTVCGIARPSVTLNDFLNNPKLPLEKVIVPIDEYTWLLSGAGSLLSLYGPTFRQRERLFRALNTLHFDTILFDLPAGTGREILDFFLIAYHRIIVIEPTPLSVENAYLFLKNLVYRRLFRLFHMNTECKAMLKEVMENKASDIRTLSGLMDQLAEYKPEEIEQLRTEDQYCRYWLLVNKVKNGNAVTVGTNFCTVAREHLGIPVLPLAGIVDDPLVGKSLYSKEPVLKLYPETAFSRSIEEAAVTLLHDNEKE